jgi:hypothetical protein
MVQSISLAEAGAVEVPAIVFSEENPHHIYACAENCAFQVDTRQVRFRPCCVTLIRSHGLGAADRH